MNISYAEALEGYGKGWKWCAIARHFVDPKLWGQVASRCAGCSVQRKPKQETSDEAAQKRKARREKGGSCGSIGHVTHSRRAG